MSSNGLTCTAVEGQCILLRRLAYPNRLTDLVPIVGLHPTHLSVMFNFVLEHVHSNFEHLISDLDQPWLREGQVRSYAHVSHRTLGYLSATAVVSRGLLNSRGRHTSCRDWAPRRDPFPLCHKQTSMPVWRPSISSESILTVPVQE